MRDNALCQTASGFDARLRKIRRVAQPEADNDVVNKKYVDISVKHLKEHLEEIERKIITLVTNMQTLQIMLDEMLRNTTHQSAKDT